MKKKTLFLSTLTSSLTASATTFTLVRNFTKKALYRSELTPYTFSLNDYENVKIKNHKGLILNGYLKTKENAKYTFIMMHPAFQTLNDLKSYVSYFEALLPNANVLLTDASAHGYSDGYIRGFGYRDIFDLMYWNTYILQKFGSNHKIIMYGKQMGANTILNTAGLGKLKNVEGIISDSAYTDVLSYFAYLCKEQLHISPLISKPMIHYTIKNEIGQNVKKMDTALLVKKNTIPTIYIASKNDPMFKNVFPLYNHNDGEKVLFPIKEEHLYDMKQDDYAKTLEEFLKQYVLDK